MSADLRVVSFGYGHLDDAMDIPPADITVDVRDWFRDPHIDPKLRNLTGLDPAVIQKVMDTRGVQTFVSGLCRVADDLLTLQVRPVTVAVGCVGGRHRSVAIVDLLADRARERGWSVEVEHLHVHLPVVTRDTQPHSI